MKDFTDFTYDNSRHVLMLEFPELKTSPFITNGYDLDIPYSLYQGFCDLMVKEINEGKFKEADKKISFISKISNTKFANGIDLVLDCYDTIRQDEHALEYFLLKLEEPGLSYFKAMVNWDSLTIEEQTRFRKRFVSDERELKARRLLNEKFTNSGFTIPEQLITAWDSFVEQLETDKYKGIIEEYWNDLDIRYLIQEIGYGDYPLVREIDNRFKKLLIHTEKRIWECTNKEIDDWWNFGFPKTVTGYLKEEFEGRV
jgi:hypothetical protein